MDISEFEKVAAARWQETASPVAKITELVLSIPENKGWEVASIYAYHCFTGYNAYSVVLWKNCGIKNGLAIIQLKGSLVTFNEDTNTYHVEKVMKIF